MGQATDYSNSVTAKLTRAYTTFSGVDITAIFDDMVIMTLQGIAVSITREKVPVYCLGSARPKSISRGKRGIAGTMQFVLFDRDALNSLVRTPDHRYYAHANEVNWLLNTFNAASYSQDVDDAYINHPGDFTGIGGHPFTQTGTLPRGTGNPTVAKSVAVEAQYMDQIFPFDVTLIAQNEYGQGSWSSIVGCEIINEGGGISMDDITSEEQATFIAIHRHPWTPIVDDRDSGSVMYSASQVQMNAAGELITTGTSSQTPGTPPVTGP